MAGAARTWPVLVVSGLSRTEDAELLQATLTDFEIAAIDETSPDGWRVFFHTPPERDRAVEQLRATFPGLTISPTEMADDDWAARSQAELRAVQVGNIIVAPPWDAPITIVIQPSMGFGTGHHATTQLCLAALQRVQLRGRTVLDIGTGSGILAIAASRLGADTVTAIDDDADAIQAAWENLALNAGAIVTLIVGDLRTTDLAPADVIIANLTGGLLIAAAERLRKLANARARLILSGFMTHEERDVLDAYGAFAVEHRTQEDEWLCVTLTG